jgi:NAD(P)-dependent dehydrogenase (short-subunit alcohol dehydrogenase family)
MKHATATMGRGSVATAPLLEGKTAIIYGGGGFIGRVVARTFAREGANLFLVGRTAKSLKAVAGPITEDGGTAHTAVVDVLDEAAVEQHARSVVKEAGGIDISFNLISRGDVQGTRLLEMRVDDFLLPITTGVRASFITARVCARHMVERGSGVILMVTSGSGGAATPPEVWPMGGTGPADAAMESFMRYLGAEVGPMGVRTACLWTAGAKDVEADSRNVDPHEAQKDQLIGSSSMLRRRPTVQELAEMAAFIASDRGSGVTASVVNVNSGLTTH